MAEEKRKLGQILVDSGAINLKELEDFLTQQEELKDERGYQTKLGPLLLEHQLVNEETLAQAFSIQQDIEYVNLKDFSPDLKILEKIPFSIFTKFKFVPLYMDSDKLVISLHDPIDTFLFDLLYKALGLSIEIRSSTRSHIDEKHTECLQAIQSSGRINNDFDVNFEEYRLILQQEKGGEEKEIKTEVSTSNTRDKLSFLELVNELEKETNFSAFHIYPLGSNYKIFGKENDQWSYYCEISSNAFSAVWLSAKQNTDYKEHDINFCTQTYAQILLSEDDRKDVTLYFITGVSGNELIIESYPLDNKTQSLSKLGLLPSDLNKLHNLNFSERGALIIGGQSSGKSTTYHALLDHSSKNGDRVFSLESQILVNKQKITQVQLDEERQQLQALSMSDSSVFGIIGLDQIHLQELAPNLRLIKNTPTFVTCNAHPIFPTLVGLEKSGESLGSILSKFHFIIFQKLVPSLCPYCIQPHRPTSDEITQLGLKPASLKKPIFYFSSGCDYCENKGYTDFTLIYELLTINSSVLKILSENPLGNELAMHLLKSGALTPLNNVAKDKLYSGKISLQTYAQIVQKKI
ncbi:MAG: hypothetical protein COB02_01220 [Candidatus Cloacimonadota bacterium]|nr:MAG: hypothetical protein COB02_01220 [Candidatus Cloacimonadota bacterium]